VRQRRRRDVHKGLNIIREQLMKSVFGSMFILVLLGLAPIQSANAQNAPEWVKQTFPPAALKAAVEEQKAVFDPHGALDAKAKHLIGLGVAAQIPCQYCVYAMAKHAKAEGATDAEIKEAIAAAALTRKWSTVLNGTSYDFAKFKQQLDAATAKKAATTDVI
jgi:AhpD family alkylhydroperoxidase